MKSLVAAAALGALLWSGAAHDVRAGGADAAALLFEAEHFAAAPADTTLSYEYRRTSKDPAATRPSFADTIELKLAPAAAPARRTVEVVLFKSPMHHRAAGPFEDVAFNPLVILMLEYHLGDFAKILGGNPRYFKNAIRAGLRERAVAEPVRITVGGREVEATRITVKPFEADPQAARFGAFVATSYQFVVSDAVPGAIQEIRIVTPDPAGGAPILEEVTRYVPN